MDALEWLRKQLDGDENDLLREMVREFAERLMAAEVDVLCGAGWGEVSPERTELAATATGHARSTPGSARSSWRSRSCVGAATSRTGCSSPAGGPSGRWWRWWPSATCAGCRTRRVEGLVKTLGIESLSKSQVSRMAAELDDEVTAFRNRPLDAGPYTYVWLDALTQKVREGGRIVNVAVVIAVGVNADGHREVLGLDVITTEDGAGWLAFLRGLVARGLAGHRPGDLRRPPRPGRRHRARR